MAEIRKFRESMLLPEQKTKVDLLEPIGDQPVRFCAYNLTGQRFISNEVAVADLSGCALRVYLSRLAPDSGVAVWIVPVQDFSARSIHFPNDSL